MAAALCRQGNQAPAHARSRYSRAIGLIGLILPCFAVNSVDFKALLLPRQFLFHILLQAASERGPELPASTEEN
jgi:hypothetical protein